MTKAALISFLFLLLGKQSNAEISRFFSETVEFILTEDRFVFAERAIELCQEQDAVLARISSFEELQFVDEAFGIANGTLLNDIGVDLFWIGVIDTTEIVDNDGAERFSFVDGFADTSFFSTPNVPPWKENQPNNFNGRQFCVNWDVGQNIWDDVGCNENLAFLCRRDLTIAPTVSPTAADAEVDGNEDNFKNNFLSAVIPVVVLLTVILGILVAMLRKVQARLNAFSSILDPLPVATFI